MSDQTSPLPWRIVHTNGGINLAGATPGYIAEIHYGNSTALSAFAMQRANAAMIVRAVNHHDELVESCKRLADVLERSDGETRPNNLPECSSEEWDAALDQARALLKRIEAK